MSWQFVALAQVQARPWRNGGGVTRELLAWPDARDWQLRVSVADITRDGPFSAFAGVERWFAVIEGAGVELRFGSRARLLPAGVPLRFDGAEAPHCTLPAGPTRDLNLMAPPGRGTMRPVVPGDRVAGPARRWIGLYAQRESLALRWNDAELEVPALTLAWRLQDTGAQGQLLSGAGWWLEVEP